MKNWKIATKNALVAQYIDCYWFLQKDASDNGPEQPKLNPDPAAHLILCQARQPYHYQSGSELSSGRGSHLLLPYRQTLTMDHSEPFSIVGIKFQVGALYGLKLPTQQPLLDTVMGIDVAKLIGPINESKLFAQAIAQAEHCADQLDLWLQPFISQRKVQSGEDKHSELVRQVLAIFPTTALAQLGMKLGCSQRTIERSFLRVTGFTLKQYFSMQRLEAVLEYVHKLSTEQIIWADIAAQFGFSDQPHLVRYLKSYIGSTPGQYSQLRDLAIDVYGNFE